MSAKISEKQWLFGILFLVAGVAVLLNTTLVNAPVRISEKGILVGLIGVALLSASVKFFSKTFHRQ